jgi:hypothetical protein
MNSPQEELKKILENQSPFELLRKFASKYENYLFYFLESNFEKENENLKYFITKELNRKKFTLVGKDKTLSRKIIQMFLKMKHDEFYPILTELSLLTNPFNFLILQQEILKFQDFELAGFLEKLESFNHNSFKTEEYLSFLSFLFPQICELFPNSFKRLLCSTWMLTIFKKTDHKKEYSKMIMKSTMNENSTVDKYFVSLMAGIMSSISKQEILQILEFIGKYLEEIPSNYKIIPDFSELFRQAFLYLEVEEFSW